MHTIEQIFINGEFVTPHGNEWFDLYNPATAQVIGQVRLADEIDAERAVAAAKAAFPAWSQTTKQERLAALKRMHAAVAARHDDLLEAVMVERLDQSERRMRSLLRATPEGSSHAVGYLDNDGINQEPVRIEVSLQLLSDNITIDFTGTSPQMAGGMNCSRTATIAAVIFAVKSAFDPEGDQTGGCLRPLNIILPPGSAVNPAFPAAVSLRHLAAQRITDTLVRALSGPNRNWSSFGWWRFSG